MEQVWWQGHTLGAWLAGGEWHQVCEAAMLVCISDLQEVGLKREESRAS